LTKWFHALNYRHFISQDSAEFQDLEVELLIFGGALGWIFLSNLQGPRGAKSGRIFMRGDLSIE
jgi:hypothetical protein